MKKCLSVLIAILGFSMSSAHANWVCNVNDTKDQQYSYSAPQEDDAEKLSKLVCKTFGINSKDCTPDCFDTGVTGNRWHCSVQNSKHESWSFTTPIKAQAEKLARNLCSTHQIAANDCKPVCVTE